MFARAGFSSAGFTCVGFWASLGLFHRVIKNASKQPYLCKGFNVKGKAMRCNDLDVCNVFFLRRVSDGRVLCAGFPSAGLSSAGFTSAGFPSAGYV